HVLTVLGDALTMEGGCGKAALAQPGFALIGNQPASEDRAHVSPEERVFDEVAIVRDQNRVYEVRIAQQVNGAVAKPYAHDVAILVLDAFMEAQHITRKLGQTAQQRMPGWAGGQCANALCLCLERCNRLHGATLAVRDISTLEARLRPW